MTRQREPVEPALTAAEVAADAWHTLNAATGGQCVVLPERCWCCCVWCRLANPHYRPAWRHKLDDIRHRLDSLLESRTEFQPRLDDQRKGTPLGRKGAGEAGRDA